VVVNEAEEKKMDEDTKANMIERRKENTPGKTTKEKETVPGKSIKDKGFKTTQKKEEGVERRRLCSFLDCPESGNGNG